MNYEAFLAWVEEVDLLPLKYDERRQIGVCLHLGCSRSAQGLVPVGATGWEHDCPCCSQHCVDTEMRERAMRRQGQ